MIYLTAHRVVSPHDMEGINAFSYVRGSSIWPDAPPVPITVDTDPGELRHQRIELPPPGNRVRSFLDLVAPADVTRPEIAAAVETLSRRSAPQHLPAEWVQGRLWVRFGADRALLPFWRAELRLLGEAAAAVL